MLRLGSVPYLNALPLLDGLEDDPRVSLVQDVPSALAPRLRAGELDLALVSAVELFRDPPLGWVAGPAITSRGPVRSINLYLRTAPSAVRRVALDRSSLSAATLARLCLARFLGLSEVTIEPADSHRPLAELDADAVLRIGDPALTTDPSGWTVLDLGALWTGHTGLPFVYALWLARGDLPADTDLAPVREARERGLARRDALADGFAEGSSLDAASCRSYLAECIGYDLGPDERAGLLRFAAEARALGLVDRDELPAPLAG